MQKSILSVGVVKHHIALTDEQCNLKTGAISHASRRLETDQRYLKIWCLNTFLFFIATIICGFFGVAWVILAGLFFLFSGLGAVAQYANNLRLSTLLYKIVDANSAEIQRICNAHPAANEYCRTVTATRRLRHFDIACMNWIVKNACNYERDVTIQTASSEATAS